MHPTPPSKKIEKGVVEFGTGTLDPPSTNYSDPVYWAAKTAYEKYITKAGRSGAQIIVSYQKALQLLEQAPERGRMARRWARMLRWLCDVGRRFGLTQKRGPSWDINRDLLLAECKSLEESVNYFGMDINEVMQHKARLDMAQATALPKPNIDRGVRMEGFDRGITDRRAGRRKGHTKNPYQNGTVEHFSWEKGYKQGW